MTHVSLGPTMRPMASLPDTQPVASSPFAEPLSDRDAAILPLRIPVDQLGGWREHWSVYCVAGKGVEATVPRFKDSEHPLAGHLRRDTQGVVTNPRMTGSPRPLPPDPVASLRAMTRYFDAIVIGAGQAGPFLAVRLADRVHAQDARLRRLTTAVDRRSLPERAYRTVQRALGRTGR